MTIPAHHRSFIDNHRLCIIGWSRQAGPPALTPVFYLSDGDDLLVSVTEDRAKTRAVQRNPELSLCVLAEDMPFPYVTLTGTARIESEGAAELMMGVIESVRGNELSDEERTGVRDRAATERRVVLRFTPTASVSNLPEG